MIFNHGINGLIIFLLVFPLPFWGQSTIEGYVTIKEAHRPLPYVNIYLSDTTLGCVSDSNGFFSLEHVPHGAHILVFQRIGFKKLRLPVAIPGDTTITLMVALEPTAYNTQAIRVESMHWISPLAELFQGSHQLNSMQIVGQPGAFEDPLKALQSITGVSSHSDYTSNLYIRGSQPEDQAVVLDGLLLQNPYRAKILGYGGISVVNSDVIRDLKLSLGGFPVSYGNRLGGLIEITTRDPAHEWKNKLSVNLLAARYFLSGPISKKLGIVFSLRGTYYDFLIRKITSTKTTYPFFNDLFFKLTWKFSPAFNIRFTSLAGQEGTDLINARQMNGNLFTRARNGLFALTFSGFLNKNLNYKLIAARQSNMDSLFSSSSFIGNYSHYRTKIQRSNLLGKIEWEALPWLFLATGGELTNVEEQATHQLQHLINSNPTSRAKIRYRASNVYLDSHFNLRKSLRAKLGVRADYSTLNKKLTIDPRFSLRWQIYGELYASLAWGIFRQFPQMINLNSKHEPITAPDILARMRSPKLNYWGLGLGHKLFSRLILRLEAYYKDTRFLRGEYVAKIENSSTTISITDDWRAMAKGLEFNLAYMSKNWQSQLGYVYSVAKFKKNIYSPWEYQYFDNRHWLSWSFRKKLSAKLRFSSLIKASSGFPISEPLGWTKSNTNEWTVIPVNVTKRHPYFRWDIRLSYQTERLQTYFEIINVTNHRNFDQALYYITQNEAGETMINRDVIYMLPRLPVFGFSLSF